MVPNTETRTVPFPLTLLRFSTLPEDSNGGHCLSCNNVLELSQPDSQLPDRMVGVCEACGRWYVIDFLSATGEAVMLLLPDGDALRSAHIGRVS